MPDNRFATMPLIILALVLSTFGIMLARSAIDSAPVDQGSRPREELRAESKSDSQVVRVPTFAGVFH